MPDTQPEIFEEYALAYTNPFGEDMVLPGLDPEQDARQYDWRIQRKGYSNVRWMSRLVIRTPWTDVPE